MRTGGKSALTVRGACFAAGFTFLLATALADYPIQIEITDHSVSILAKDTSIRSVLDELVRRSNLVVVSQVVLDELVTVDIEERTLPEALRHLLRQRSFMLHQDVRATGNAPYIRLWIMSSGIIESRPSRTPGANENELIHYQILAMSKESGERVDAMAGFGDFEGSIAVGYLQQGLFDPDERVRDAAIDSLAELGGRDSIRALGLVLNDPDANTRVDIVDALGEIGGQEVVRLLEIAVTDENHTVSEAAAEWLTELAWQPH